MQKWEYARLSINWNERVTIDGKEVKNAWSFWYGEKIYSESSLDSIINEMGEKGWELVSTIPFTTTFHPGPYPVTATNRYTLFFKRSM